MWANKLASEDSSVGVRPVIICGSKTTDRIAILSVLNLRGLIIVLEDRDFNKIAWWGELWFQHVPGFFAF